MNIMPCRSLNPIIHNIALLCNTYPVPHLASTGYIKSAREQDLNGRTLISVQSGSFLNDIATFRIKPRSHHVVKGIPINQVPVDVLIHRWVVELELT